MYLGHDDQRFGCITYSQNGEDLLITEIFNTLKIDNPIYLDIGSHHPLHISNTAKMYLNGSYGITVDANPNLLQMYSSLRPIRNKHIQAGVLPASVKCKYKMFDYLSGRNTFSEKGAAEFSDKYDWPVASEKDVPILTLNTLVDKYCEGVFPHFLSMDIEDMDLAVMTEADFSKSAPKVICVETRLEDRQSMTRVLKAKNFVPYVCMGENVIYLHLYIAQIFANRIGL